MWSLEFGGSGSEEKTGEPSMVGIVREDMLEMLIVEGLANSVRLSLVLRARFLSKLVATYCCNFSMVP